MPEGGNLDKKLAKLAYNHQVQAVCGHYTISAESTFDQLTAHEWFWFVVCRRAKHPCWSLRRGFVEASAPQSMSRQKLRGLPTSLAISAVHLFQPPDPMSGAPGAENAPWRRQRYSLERSRR